MKWRPRIWWHRLACYVAGHRWSRQALDHGFYECEHCDYWDYLEPLRRPLWLHWWPIRNAILDRWYRFRGWLRCRECGGRFGRHDHSQDHLPF